MNICCDDTDGDDYNPTPITLNIGNTQLKFDETKNGIFKRVQEKQEKPPSDSGTHEENIETTTKNELFYSLKKMNLKVEDLDRKIKNMEEIVRIDENENLFIQSLGEYKKAQNNNQF